MAEMLIDQRMMLIPAATSLGLFIVREIAVALLHTASGEAWTALRPRLSWSRRAARRKERQ